VHAANVGIKMYSQLITRSIKTLTLSLLLVTAMMDSIPDKYWPVWARVGNDNIISRIKIFGERNV
jgi:hypothetical protein